MASVLAIYGGRSKSVFFVISIVVISVLKLFFKKTGIKQMLLEALYIVWDSTRWYMSC